MVDVADDAHVPRGSTPASTGPSRPIGWWAIGMSAAGMLVAFGVLPAITGLLAETYPVTNTWVMPAIGMVFLDLAVALNVLCLGPLKERSALNIVAAVVTILPALFLTLSLTLGG